MDMKVLERELQEARRARLDAEAAGGHLESLVEQIRLGLTLQEIELGLGVPVATSH